jgi:glycosyltransferase involved in cell wall biosynthesis
LKVSVIIPIYNGEMFLREALDSVLAQTYPLHEIIAIDDGSTDSSPEILRSYGQQLTLCRQENQGVAAARNAGLRLASGDAIAFIDQDDLWPPDRLRQMAEALQADPQSQVVVGLVETLYQRDVPPKPDDYIGTAYRDILMGSLLFRASIFRELGELSTKVGYSDDTEFWARRIDNATKTIRLPIVTLTYRLHTANTSYLHYNHNDNVLAILHERLKRRRGKSHEHKLSTPRL